MEYSHSLLRPFDTKLVWIPGCSGFSRTHLVPSYRELENPYIIPGSQQRSWKLTPQILGTPTASALVQHRSVITQHHNTSQYFWVQSACILPLDIFNKSCRYFIRNLLLKSPSHPIQSHWP